MNIAAAGWLAGIRALSLPHKVRIMNVCGGHERTVSMSGLRSILPPDVELIPGPGCPVCVCPEEDIHDAIRLALDRRVILLAFGDMLRVPASVSKGEVRSLDQARAAGADVRPVASPLEAARIARANPARAVVFFAAGFETTTAPLAAMLLEGERPAFDALLAPGHVCAIMGANEWSFVVEKHALPAAVAGFTADSLLAATYSVLRQVVEGRRFLDNCYGEVVRPDGNAVAQQALRRAFDIVDAQWRGIGVIPRSGFRLTPAFAPHDARLRFPVAGDGARKRAGQMPPGCDCAKVVLGKIYPDQCRLYGRACTPREPVGPCMVSEEGACRIWWANRRRAAAPAIQRG